MANIRHRTRHRNGQGTAILVEKSGVNPLGVTLSSFPATRKAVFSFSAKQLTSLEAAYKLAAGYFGAGSVVNIRRSGFRDRRVQKEKTYVHCTSSTQERRELVLLRTVF